MGVADFFFASCGSDELSNRKAEELISKCLEKDPKIKKRTHTVTIQTEGFVMLDNDLEKYQELEDKGFIELKAQARPKKPKGNDPMVQLRYERELRRYNRTYKNTYDIKITQKGEKYIDETLENQTNVKIKNHFYELDKVLEVQEIPSQNRATVKVQFHPVDLTPFSILYDKDPSEFWITDVKMFKTSNGWKYCDDY